MTGEKIILWGRPTSTNVQKILWLLDELALPYDHKIVGGQHGGLDTDSFGRMNPNRTVPVLQDGGLTIWESHAILRYLCNKSGALQLYPVEVGERAHVDMWLDWHITVFWPPIRTVFLDHVRDQKRSWDDPVIVSAVQAIHRNLDFLADAVGKVGFIARPSFTIADIPLAVGLNRLVSMDLPVALHSHVENWARTLRAMPSFDSVVSAEQPIIEQRKMS
ncbi:MAG: glutathione S-transferase [Rhodospirillales bacterium]|nr:glutathione S-transferase [Rhodospirillales bacterium]